MKIPAIIPKLQVLISATIDKISLERLKQTVRSAATHPFIPEGAKVKVRPNQPQVGSVTIEVTSKSDRFDMATCGILDLRTLSAQPHKEQTSVSAFKKIIDDSIYRMVGLPTSDLEALSQIGKRWNVELKQEKIGRNKRDGRGIVPHQAVIAVYEKKTLLGIIPWSEISTVRDAGNTSKNENWRPIAGHKNWDEYRQLSTLVGILVKKQTPGLK